MTHLVSDRQGLEFQIQMIEEAFDVHELDTETGERCCTADQPCRTRWAITQVHAEASAKLAALDGNGRTHEVPEDAPKTGGQGSAQTTSRRVSNPASEKQAGYIKKLAAQHDTSNIGKFPARTLAEIERGDEVSKTRASSLIDVLRRQPLAANAEDTAPKASEKQLGYLRSLMTQKGYTVHEDKLAKLGPRDASELIDMLKTRPDAPKAEAKPATELEDGMYRKDGRIYKVQHAVHGSGRQYAKELVGDAEQGFGFEYSPGAIRKLTNADRMTLEEAKEFGALYGTCCVCGRTLTRESSIAEGIGPVCSGKV